MKPGLLDASGAIRDLSGVVSAVTPRATLCCRLDRSAFAATRSVHAAGRRRHASAWPVRRRRREVHLRRAELFRPCRRIQHGGAEGTHHLHEGDVVDCRPERRLEIPRDSQKTDWEVELGVVIGKTANTSSRRTRWRSRRLLRRARCLGTRVPARRHRAVGQGQERRYVRTDRAVARDARRDPPTRQQLDMWLDVDGQALPDGNTRTMVFDVAVPGELL